MRSAKTLVILLVLGLWAVNAATAQPTARHAIVVISLSKQQALPLAKAIVAERERFGGDKKSIPILFAGLNDLPPSDFPQLGLSHDNLPIAAVISLTQSGIPKAVLGDPPAAVQKITQHRYAARTIIRRWAELHSLAEPPAEVYDFGPGTITVPAALVSNGPGQWRGGQCLLLVSSQETTHETPTSEAVWMSLLKSTQTNVTKAAGDDVELKPELVELGGFRFAQVAYEGEEFSGIYLDTFAHGHWVNIQVVWSNREADHKDELLQCLQTVKIDQVSEEATDPAPGLGTEPAEPNNPP